MRTVSLRQIDMAHATIPIGYEGENEFTQVRIDCKKTFQQYPDAVASLAVTDPSGRQYSVAVVKDGTVVVWNVIATDVASRGTGEIQINFLIDGTIVAKSAIAKTMIKRSIDPSGGGGGGTSNYNDLSNKPKINGYTLSGNVTLQNIGALSADALAEAIATALAQAKASGEFDGADGQDGADGVGIASIAKTGTSGLVDTYTITLTSGSTYTFTVTNGQDGAPGDDGQDGQDGFSPTVTVTTITGGHRVTITDAQGAHTFDVMDGQGGGGGGAVIDDTAGHGDTSVVWSAGKTFDEVDSLKEAITPLTPSATSGDVGKFMKVKTVSGGKVTAYEFGSAGGGGSVDLFYVTPEDYGAVGDGETDDSEAVQAACDAGYAVYFGSNKTYYLAETVNIDHDCHLFGGENTVIKTKTPTGGEAPDAIIVSGTLKKTTTLTSDYTTGTSSGDNCSNKFTLEDMTDIAIGDILVIRAEDQYFSYARQYYYLGGTLIVTDINGGHIYTSSNLPFDITASENVSVKVYSAPTVVVENLHFESDLDSLDSYTYLLTLKQCKNSTIKNCVFGQMANGLMLYYCFNTNVSNVMLSKSKNDNTLNGDCYGISAYTCRETVFDNVIAMCAQHAITVSGYEPSVNTYIRNCNLASECRSAGLDAHESNYNLIIEDSVIGGASLCGIITASRCKFIKNERPGVDTSLSVHGSHNSLWASLTIRDSEFVSSGIYVTASSTQNPVQAYNSIYGKIDVKNCKGGSIIYNPYTDQTILSDTIDKILIENWDDCLEIKNPGTGKINTIIVKDSTFTEKYFINNHSGTMVLGNVGRVDIQNTIPEQHQVYVKETIFSRRYVLPKDVLITLASNNQSAKYRICGLNVAPNVLADYEVGSVSGNAGQALTRTPYTGGNVSLAVDANGNPVWTQGDNTSRFEFYTVGLPIVDSPSTVNISATLKNTGATDGASFRPYLVMVDTATGLVTKRKNGSDKAATAEGVTISHTYDAEPGEAVLFYFSCAVAVANSETTFEDVKFEIVPKFAAPVTDYPYESKSRTGDGTVKSLEGVNYIMSSESSFTVSFSADLANNPV